MSVSVHLHANIFINRLSIVHYASRASVIVLVCTGAERGFYYFEERET